MEIKEFIEDLKKSNFLLAIENDKLILKGDKKVGKDEMQVMKKNDFVINFIKDNKSELIKYLTLFPDKSYSGKKSKNISSIYRLSSLQEGILFHGLYNEGSGVYIEQFACDIIGLDAGIFNKSWTYVLKGHSILRSSFYYAEFNVPVQCVFREVLLPVEELDYRLMNEAQQGEAIKQYEELDRQKGFDFKVAPLMRVTLIRLSEDRYRMVWTYHHILLDGWSMPILMEELLSTYEVLVAGKEVKTKDEDHYEDYIRYIDRSNKDQEEMYWRNYMKSVDQATLLPFVNTTKERNKGLGTYKSLSLQVDAETTAKIEKFAQKSRITVNTVMQGVWSYLLYRYTGNPNIVYGAIVSGRPDDLPDVEHRVGLYINNLPLHAIVAEEQGIEEWLQDLQKEQVSSRQYQHTALLDIQRWTGVQGDLFDSLLVFENYPINKLLSSKHWKLQVENIRMQDQTNYLLNIIISTAEQINIRFLYNSTLLEETYIRKIHDHFEHVLLQIINNEKRKLGEIQLLTKAEEHQLLAEFNDTKADYPKNKSIVDLFEEQAAKTPEATAVVFEKEQLSYQQLNERANQLAHYLKNKGVKEEILVPICIERGLDMIVGMFGILKAGGAYVPIDPEYPQERISYMLEDTSAALVISSKESRSKLQTSPGVEVIELNSDWSAISTQSTSNLQTDTQPHQLAYVIYTSGSTGKPKGVMIEHRNVFAFISWCQQEFSESQFKIAYASTSICFDLSVYEIFYPLCIGRPIRIIENGLNIDKYLSEDRSVLINSVPVVVENLLKAETDLSNVSVINMAGEPISLYTQQKLDTESIEVRNLYGPTEDTTYSTVFRLRSGVPVLIGKPISNTYIYILNERGELLPVGVNGEICIGGAGLARGYLNRSELTAEKFVKDPFSKNGSSRLYRTGDLGRWLADGNIEYLGRVDNQVKIRGYRIELGEIESVLQQSELVSQAVVIAKKDGSGNKRLIGYVVSAEVFNKKAIITYLKSKLPEYMVPALWVELQQLPLTPNGKIDRKALPDPETDELSGSEYVAPRNEMEEKLVAFWQELLGVEKVGINDNFFELGGHSLLVMRMVSYIERNLLLSIPIKILFEFNTISDLSKYLATQQGAITQEKNTAAFELIDV